MNAPQMPVTFYTKAFNQGQPIFREGQDGSYACLINQGQVEVSREVEGQKVVLAVLGRGDLFGEMALLGTDRRTASVTALEYTEVVIFDSDRLGKALEESSPLLNNLVRSLVQRLAATTGMVRKQPGPEEPLVALAHLVRACLESSPRDAQGLHGMALSKLADHAQAILGMPLKTVKDHLLLLARYHLLTLEKVATGVMVMVKSPALLPRQAADLAAKAGQEPEQGA